MIKGFVRIPNRSDVSCIDIFLCAKGFDSPSNAGEGIWPRQVSKKKGVGAKTVSHDFVLAIFIILVHRIGPMTRLECTSAIVKLIDTVGCLFLDRNNMRHECHLVNRTKGMYL